MRFDHPLLRADWPGIGEALLRQRKEQIAERDYFLVASKAAGNAGDRELARLFKQEAAEYMKAYRACALLIPWFVAVPPGDCKLVPPRRFPKELHPYLRLMASAAELAVGWP